MVRDLAVISVLWATPALAQAVPPACAPNTPYEYCGLIVQRNNAENDVINEQATRHREGDYWARWVQGDLDKAAWWQRYDEGVALKEKEAAAAAETRAARAAEKGARR